MDAAAASAHTISPTLCAHPKIRQYRARALCPDSPYALPVGTSASASRLRASVLPACTRSSKWRFRRASGADAAWSGPPRSRLCTAALLASQCGATAKRRRGSPTACSPGSTRPFSRCQLPSAQLQRGRHMARCAACEKKGPEGASAAHATFAATLQRTRQSRPMRGTSPVRHHACLHP
eukprot:363932-Chlamydomonas_euryale.AAC.15